MGCSVGLGGALGLNRWANSAFFGCCSHRSPVGCNSAGGCFGFGEEDERHDYEDDSPAGDL